MLKWVAILKSVMTKTAKSFDKKSLIARYFYLLKYIAPLGGMDRHWNGYCNSGNGTFLKVKQQ